MDAAFANISEGIEKVATELLTKRKERGDSTPQPAVYLAETDDGQMRPYRERIVKQLEAQGCRILPPPEEDDPLPDESPDYENKVREYLEEARLSVHLVGGRYGRSVTGRSDVSATELQNALAEERRKAGGFESLIWIPPEVVPQSPRQKAFHEYLELNPEAQKNAEVWRRPFESFKGRIVEKLKKNDPPLPGPIKTIYLMCERRDYPSVRSVKDFLFNNGFEVFVLPSLDGQGPGAAFHENFLRSCDATLIYCGATDEDWVSYMILDMLNACRLRERGDFLCKALFLANPLADFQTHVAEILKHDGNSVESSLGPFIKCLQRNGATGGARP
jgi:hypothetical protein